MSRSGVAVPGFRASGVRCGIKERGLDVALLVSDVPAAAAGVFTRSTVVGAPVTINRGRIRSGRGRAIIANSGCSNVAMGARGLREGIGLRGYAQRDPKVEYQREGYELFAELDDRVDSLVLERVFKVVIREPQLATEPVAAAPRTDASGPPAPSGSVLERRPAAAPSPRPAPAQGARGGPVPKVGRNEPCPCGSGRKYKKCHGAA